MRLRRAAIAVGCLPLWSCVSCGVPAERPTFLPAFPDALASPHSPTWAAFELTLNVDGRVLEGDLRVLGWEASGAGPNLYVTLRAIASGTRWAASTGRKLPRRVVLVLDGTGRPVVGAELLRAIRRRVEAGVRARRRASRALARESAPAREHDLDAAWMRLAGLGSGMPFPHDDVRGWRELEPRLRAVEQTSGGFWVCRAARGTHSGQFVFLDAELRVLAVRSYILGE